MNLAEHPTVRRFHESQRTPRPRRAAEAPRCGVAASTVPRLRGRRRRLGRDQPPGPGRPAGRHPACLPAHQDAPQLRLPHEPGADPQPGPVGRQPRIPPHRRSRQRGRPQGRGDPGEAGRPGAEPGDGLPDGDGPLSGREDLGRVAQAGRRRCGPGSHGHPPQRHPPQVRQLHPAGHGPDRCRGHRLRPADLVQPVPGMQAVRGGVSRGGHRPGRRLQLLGLLHAQLPGVHGRLHRLGRADRRQQGRPGLPQEGGRHRNRRRCGKASPSGPTTRRRTA